MLIVYGSLYPWRFEPAHLTGSPFRILLHSWHPLAWPYLLRDVMVNVALYVPLGFAAHLVFRKYRLPGFNIYGPVLLGLLLSTAMELTQLLEPSRDTSIIDVITNVIGSGLGVMAGLLFEALASRRDFRTAMADRGAVDRGALLLAFCWAAWVFFPLFPMMSRHGLHDKLLVFTHARVLDPLPIVSAAAAWYAGGLLLAAAGLRISRAWFALTILAIPAQFFVVERQPLPPLLLGAITGVVLFAICHRRGAPTRVEAAVFLAVIVARGFSPFHFAAESTEFNWIPFGAPLGADWQSATGVLIEKTFYYGTAIWLLRAAGLTLVRSVILAAVALASIEIVQTHLPGRTPEITDPILAILLGFVLAVLSRPSQSARLVTGPARTTPVE